MDYFVDGECPKVITFDGLIDGFNIFVSLKQRHLLTTENSIAYPCPNVIICNILQQLRSACGK